MDFVKAKEILNTVEKLNPKSKESILSALDLAEHVESSSRLFYINEAQRTKGTELESFFNFLVKEEDMHLKKILELKKIVKEDHVKKISFEHNNAPKIHIGHLESTEMTAILYALWREKKAVEFYSGAADKTKGSVKKFFEDLAEFEKVHVALLEQYVEEAQNTDELIMG